MRAGSSDGGLVVAEALDVDVDPVLDRGVGVGLAQEDHAGVLGQPQPVPRLLVDARQDGEPPVGVDLELLAVEVPGPAGDRRALGEVLVLGGERQVAQPAQRAGDAVLEAGVDRRAEVVVVGVVHAEAVGEHLERRVLGRDDAELGGDGVGGQPGQVAQPLGAVELVELQPVPRQGLPCVAEGGGEGSPGLEVVQGHLGSSVGWCGWGGVGRLLTCPSPGSARARRTPRRSPRAGRLGRRRAPTGRRRRRAGRW